MPVKSNVQVITEINCSICGSCDWHYEHCSVAKKAKHNRKKKKRAVKKPIGEKSNVEVKNGHFCYSCNSKNYHTKNCHVAKRFKKKLKKQKKSRKVTDESNYLISEPCDTPGQRIVSIADDFLDAKSIVQEIYEERGDVDDVKVYKVEDVNLDISTTVTAEVLTQNRNTLGYLVQHSSEFDGTPFNKEGERTTAQFENLEEVSEYINSVIDDSPNLQPLTVKDFQVIDMMNGGLVELEESIELKEEK